jgi:hypothetical protein
MASESLWGEELTEHPLLSKLRSAGAEDTITLWGYVGPSSEEAVVRLHPSLENLADFIEVARDDILHVEDVPESILLFGAKIVWVRADAKITRHHLETAETIGPVAPKANAVEVRQGRLRMRVPERTRESDCHTPCAMCQSTCTVCISICQHVPPPPASE